jgi:hypothetical protein
MNGRFARVPIWAFRADINLRALRVLGAICAHVDAAGQAYPSLDTIAAMSGVARNKIFSAIDELENAGLLHRNRATDGGRGNSTRYQIVFQGPGTGPAVGPDISLNRSRRGTCMEAGNRSRQIETRPAVGPLTERTEKDSERARACELFMRFKNAYPSRGDNGDPEKPARLEFEAALERGVEAEDIIAGAARYAAQVARAGTEPRFVKMAANWLKNESWNDEARPVPRRRPVAGMA